VTRCAHSAAFVMTDSMRMRSCLSYTAA
jgi:hypothetical protein